MNHQHFWADNSYLGQRECPTLWPADPQSKARGTLLAQHNTAYFCPVCGNIWGRVTYDQAAPLWHILSRHCEEHGQGGWPTWASGSLAATFPGVSPLSVDRTWPLKALQREAELLMRKAERGLLIFSED